jgi:hypothetical protein
MATKFLALFPNYCDAKPCRRRHWRHISWVLAPFVPIVVFVQIFLQSPATAETPAVACGDLQHDMAAAPAGPVLLPSFPTAAPGPLRHAAFLYDNAVTAIALIACGQLTEARRIGDALVYAQQHDRFWQDGRMRNGYLAGGLPDGPMKLAGWWDEASQSWLEDRYQAGSDSGNMAWVLLALINLDQLSPDNPSYRHGALQLAGWLQRWRDMSSDADNPGGFRGGTFGHEPQPEAVGWKSTEHNTDLAATYRRLANITGDTRWQDDALSAEALVQAMWRKDAGCFAVGTAEDGKSRNDFVALDAQIWPLLALKVASPHGDDIIQRCLPGLRQADGYAYSSVLQGLWTEGTAQAAVLARLMGQDSEAQSLLRAIEVLHAPGGGYFATNRPDLPTGFMLPTDPSKPRLYFHLPHLGATAWAALAQTGFNPFTGDHRLPHR